LQINRIILIFIQDNQSKKIKSNKLNEGKLQMNDKKTLEEMIKILYIKRVHVDEMGYFSICPDSCDDCFFYEYFDVKSTPRIQEVKKLSNRFFVRSRKKRYTYYAPTEKAIKYLVKNCQKQILNDYNEHLTYLKEQEKFIRLEKWNRAKKLYQDKKKQNHFKKIKKRIDNYIAENHLVPLYSLPKLSSRPKILFAAKHSFEEIEAFLYQKEGILGVYEKIAIDWWGTHYYAPPSVAEPLNKKHIEEQVRNPSDWLINKLLHSDTSDYIVKKILEQPKFYNKAIENYKKRALKKDFTSSELAACNLGYLSDWEKENFKLLDIWEKINKIREEKEEKLNNLKIMKKARKEWKEKKEFRKAKKFLLTVFGTDLNLFDFRVSYGSAIIKLNSYVPKAKFNQLKSTFKENGGKIFKDSGSWIWEIKIPEKF